MALFPLTPTPLPQGEGIETADFLQFYCVWSLLCN